jgi:HPt (histidine-containing phosphotransfer) domain-containing protein
VSAEIDASKIAELQAVMGAEFDEIIGGLVVSIDENLREIEAAIAGGDLETAYKAAHHCRNDALMVKAGALLKALEALEQGARDGRLEGARAELGRAQEAWPPTRTALEGLLAGAS